MKTSLFISVSLLALFSCVSRTKNRAYADVEISNNQTAFYSDTSKNDSSYVYTGFYFLADTGQSIKMQKDHSSEVYSISKNPFASVKNVLRATVQKNTIQGVDTYAVNVVF